MDENMALTPYETREILFYKTDNGDVKVEILLYQENLWLTQAKMAELFEVPVSVLLGGGLEVEEEEPSELNEIAQQLAVLNDQLVQQAVRRRKVIRYAFVGVFAAIFVLIGAAIGLRVYTESQLRDEASLRTVRYECTLDGESYVYEASYNSQYQILYEGGDAWISNHVRPEQYEDVNVLSAQMQDYFEEKGGTCTIIDENP